MGIKTLKKLGIAFLFALPFDAGVWMVFNAWHYYVWTKQGLASGYTPAWGYMIDAIIGVLTAIISFVCLAYFTIEWAKDVMRQSTG